MLLSGFYRPSTIARVHSWSRKTNSDFHNVSREPYLGSLSSFAPVLTVALRYQGLDTVGQGLVDEFRLIDDLLFQILLVLVIRAQFDALGQVLDALICETQLL